MTDTISRPSLPRTSGAARPGLLRAGLPAAAWAAGAGLVLVAVPVLLLWAADSRSAAGAGVALRAVAQVWLLAHGASLEMPGAGVVGLVPLGLLALPLLLLERAARHAASQHRVEHLGDAARLAAGVAGPYALLVAVVSGLARSATVRPDAVEALVGASLLGLLGAGTGVLRSTGLWPDVLARVPGLVRRAVPLAAGALLALVGAGALLVAVSLGLHLDQARALASASTPGVVGGAGVLLIGVLLAPGLAVWGASWLAGPGFAVGVGTAVGPFGVTLGPVPAVPVLAALPTSPLPVWAGCAVLLVPLLVGALVARLGELRDVDRTGTLLAAVLTGGTMALLAALSGGPLGAARLREVGPSWWQVGLAVAAEIAVGTALWWGARALQRRLAARRTA